MHEAWERYRDLFRRCPMHGLLEWTQVSIFYNFVNTPTRMMLDASANGTLLDKPPGESLEILDKLAQNDYQHPTSRRGTTRRGPAQLDSSDTILAQIACLTNMVKNIQKQPHIQENNTLNPQPPNQSGCQNQPRQNQQQLLPRQDYQQPTDYKNLENTLTQFMAQTSAYMARTDRFIQKTDAFMDRTKMKLQNYDATLKFLEIQCKAITTRSGKILVQTRNQRGMAVSPSTATDTPAEAKNPATTDKDHGDPHNTTKGESSAESSHAKLDKSEDNRPPPPFPQRLKK
ncbi:hypothetical protein V6N11_018527 [Hibiscus sabdariffa]|uniref:Retrotransposon gag domain-containing protein n=1 Tax=Hibiscus sabdariffa TaxID=183260 RepID=A0ABR2T7Q7_9ROSI